MSVNIFGVIGLIVITLSLQSVTVNGNCMSGMSKMNPIKKASEASYKEICGKCDLKVDTAAIDAAIEKGAKPLFDKIVGYLECKEKDELMSGAQAVFKECLGKLKDGNSMCKKDTFNEFSKCAEEKSKEKNLMKLGMACCNNPGFTEIFKLLDAFLLDTVDAIKEKGLIDKSLKEWAKAKLKKESGVSGHESLVNEMGGYMKQC